VTSDTLNPESHRPSSVPAPRFPVLTFFNNFMVCTCVSVSSHSPSRWETLHLTISVSNLYDFTSFFVTKPDTVRAAKTLDPDVVNLKVPFVDDSPSTFTFQDICVW